MWFWSTNISFCSFVFDTKEMSARTLGFIAHILRKNANLHVLKRFSPHAAGSVRFVPETRLMNMSTSQNEPKFPPPHPTVMQRLTQIEDNLRFKGYSIIRIGIGVVIVAGKTNFLVHMTPYFKTSPVFETAPNSKENHRVFLFKLNGADYLSMQGVPFTY